MTPTTSLVPPRRLGALLRDARLATGRDLVDLGPVCGLSVVELDDVEHGRRPLDEATLAALVEAYGVRGVGVVPDLDEGKIAVNRTDIAVDPAYGPDAILTRYLALDDRLREMPLGTPLKLRDIDIEVLSTALVLSEADVDSRLHRLMGSRSDVADDQRRIRRQLLLPLVGVIIAATGLGTLVLVADRDAPPETDIGTPAVSEPRIVTDLGPGGAVEFNPPD